MAQEVTLTIKGKADTAEVQKLKELLEKLGPSLAAAMDSVKGPATEAAAKLGDVGASAEKSGGKIAAMAEAGKKASLALGAGILVAGAGLAAFGLSAVGAASDIAESQNKVNVVFGESAGAINELAATAATALGQTKGEVLAAAGGIGNLLTAMGQGKAEAAEMSVGMVKLAADLGSFNNASSTDVLAAMQAAMAGETEGMKKYGVAINEATLKQAAMKAGMGDNVQALSAVQKQQLSWTIMLEQTKSAQGDFANTSDGMANSMKIVKAGLSDAKAEIGAGLLPAVEKATAAFSTFLKSAKFDELKTKVIDAFSAIGDKLAAIDWEALADTAVGVFDKITAAVEFLADNPVVAKIVAVLVLIASTFGVVMVAIGPFIPLVMSVVGVISGWVAAAGGLSAILATVAAVLTGPVAIAIAVVVAAFLLWRAKGDEIKAALVAAFEAIKTGITAAWDGIKAAGAAAVAAISAHSDTIKAVVLTILTGGWYLVYQGWVQYGDQITAKTAEIVASIKQKWEDLKAATAAKWAEIKASIGAAIEAAKAKITEILAAIRAAWDAAWSGLGAIAETAWNNMVATITTVFGIINGLVDTGVAFIRDTFKLAWDTITGLNSSAWMVIGQLFQAGIDFVRGVVAAGVQLLTGDWRGAWATMSSAVSGGVDRVKAILGNLLTYLGQMKDWVLNRAMDIGRSLGDGIKNALQTGWDLVLGKLRGLVELLPQTVRDLLGIASPSKVFAMLGEWIALGLASGIQKADQKAVEALSNIVSKMVSVAGGLADFGKKIADMIVPTDAQISAAKEKYVRMTLILTDFIKSISYLGSLMPVSSIGQAGPGQINTINAGLVQLSQAFPAIAELRGLTAKNLLTGGEADWASKLSDMVGKIAGVWGGLSDNLTKMAAAKFPSESQLQQLKEATIRIALWAADSLQNPTLPSVGAAEFAASMKSITDALSTVKGLDLAGIASATETQLRIAGEKITLIGTWAKAMVEDWLASAGDAVARTAFVASLREFADMAGAAASLLKSGDVGDLSKAAELLPDQLRTLGANILLAAGWAKAMVEDWLNTAPSPEARAQLVEDMRGFEAMVSAAVGIAKASVIGELKAEIVVNIQAVKDVLTFVRDTLAPAIAEIVGAWGMASDAAEAATKRMGEFSAWIGAALSIAKASEVGELKAEILVNMTRLTAILDWMRVHFAPAMQAIADAWIVAADEAERATAQMQRFAGWITAAVAVAKASEVGDLKADIGVDVGRLVAILNWLRDVFAPTMQGIADAWGVAEKEAKRATEQMQSFTSWIGAAAAVAKVTEIGEIKAGVLVNMTVMTAILEWMRDTFVPAIQGIADRWGLGAEAAKPIVERMQAFASVIKAAVDIAKSADVGALAGTLSPANLGAGLNAVKANVLALFKMIGEIGKEITTAEALARAELAEALGRGAKAFGDFGSGIAGLLGLAESKLFGSNVSGSSGPLSFAQRTRGRRADFFAQQLRDTVIRAVGAMQQALAGINIVPDDPKTTAITQLGDAFKALAEGLQALADAKMPNVAQIAAVVAASSGVGGVGGAAGAAGGGGTGGGKSGRGVGSTRGFGGGGTANLALTLTQPVQLDTETIGVAIERTINVRNLKLTIAPSGTA